MLLAAMSTSLDVRFPLGSLLWTPSLQARQHSRSEQWKTITHSRLQYLAQFHQLYTANFIASHPVANFAGLHLLKVHRSCRG